MADYRYTADQHVSAVTHAARLAREYYQEHPHTRSLRAQAAFLECLAEAAGRLAEEGAAHAHPDHP